MAWNNLELMEQNNVHSRVCKKKESFNLARIKASWQWQATYPKEVLCFTGADKTVKQKGGSKGRYNGGYRREASGKDI